MFVTFPQEPTHEHVLILDRTFDAPRPIVWRAWTDPRWIVRWWGPHGFTVPVCEQDLRPQGEYRFCMRAPDGSDHWVWGAYHEIREPEFLQFTWQREDEDGLRKDLNNLVTLTFTALGNRTHLNLHHSVFQTIADCKDHRFGWTQTLDRLAEVVAPPV
jgi:uncharacterized protein YndB with AHSA1/START domain